jgi:hypothetical protein
LSGPTAIAFVADVIARDRRPTKRDEMRGFNRRHRLVIRVGVRALASIMTMAIVLTLGAGTASAKTTTLHFFEKSSLVFYQANGQPMTSSAFVPGDNFKETDVDYVGNHEKHAKTSTATGNLVCTFTSSSLEAICDGELAVGRSKLLSDHVMVDFAAAPIVLAINGGTGVFKNARGIATHTCFRSCSPTVPSWTSYFDDTFQYTR